MKTVGLWITLLFCLCLILLRWLFGSPLLFYNASASAPLGWYWLAPAAALQQGRYALADLPDEAARLADLRGYLPRNVPLLKPIAAQFGQLVCEREGVVSIDGVVVAAALPADHLGRPLIAWTMCRQLTQDELFLLNPHRRDSFDSRYFGPIQRSNVLGTAHPVWTWQLH